MQYRDLFVVPLDSIPTPPYETPSNDLPALYAASKRMEELCMGLNGMGLAAAQVGLPWRLFVFRTPEQGFRCYFDCEYEPILPENKMYSVEGCLSIPGEHYAVDRHDRIKVTGMRLFEGSEGPEAEPFTSEFSGVTSVILQHEIDHDKGRERMVDTIGKKVFPV